MADLDALEVAGVRYVKRRYTRKPGRKTAGHGWLRIVEPGTPMERQTEIGAEGKQLLDEIERLRTKLGEVAPKT